MVRTGANGRRSEMSALAAGRGGFDKARPPKNDRLNHSSGGVLIMSCETWGMFVDL